MRVLYVAPRYHTNQLPIVKGWIANGHEVMFISQFCAALEDYSILKPIVLGYWKPIDILIHTISRLRYGKQYTVEREYALKIKAGLPPIGKMKKYIKQFQPDIVILRERSIYNIPFYQYCKKKNILCILYNQSPVWDNPKRDGGIGHRILLRFLPKYRITPVLGKREQNTVEMKNSFYVPFVIEPHVRPAEKEHFRDGKIQMICVGRYEERKNLFMLIEVINELSKKYELFLTIVGEATDEGQEQYYKRLINKVKEYGLDSRVALLKNLDQKKLYEQYRRADIFVLPSTRERASVSQLEAMSCCVPTICSDTNGTACYVKNGKNGYIFRDMDRDDLKQKIALAVANKEKLVQMGINSYNEVMEEYQFPNYYHSILNIIGLE